MGRIEIDKEKCKACYLCMDVCGRKAIKISKETNQKGYHPIYFTDENGCGGCGVCAMTCPDCAITKVYR